MTAGVNVSETQSIVEFYFNMASILETIDWNSFL